jgi:hypothetical protein
LTPFDTPKKRFQYTSGVDISSLVRTPKGAFEPSVSSPLKYSVTPNKSGEKGKRKASLKEDDADVMGVEDEEERERSGLEGEETEIRTPTKRVKYAIRSGVDLEKASEELTGVGLAGPSRSRSGRGRRNEGVGAFFAMRPGASIAGTALGTEDTGDEGRHEGFARPDLARKKRVRVDIGRKRVKQKIRRDWTYSEKRWDISAAAGQAVLSEVSSRC